MANQSALRKIQPAPMGVDPVANDSAPISDDELVRRLLSARNSNEVAAVIGLLPITGISGPKVFY